MACMTSVNSAHCRVGRKPLDTRLSNLPALSVYSEVSNNFALSSVTNDNAQTRPMPADPSVNGLSETVGLGHP